MPNSSVPGDQEVQMDRRWKNRREAADEVDTVETADEEQKPREFNPPRRRKQRRRQIDPTTCERDYNQEEILFMQALDEYKRSSGRMFPTCSEILEVVRGLGYTKLSDEERQLIESINEVEPEADDLLDENEDSLTEELGAFADEETLV